MPVPTISATQSILGYKQWEHFEFQPYATNNPTKWMSNNPLPAGLSFDNPTQYSFTGTDTDDKILCSETFSANAQIVLWEKTGGSSIATNTIYYVRDIDAGVSFKLATTPDGSVVDLGSDISAGKLSRKPTGKISGSAEVPGVWVLGVVASNADGDSAEQQFTIGIEPGALIPDSLPWLAINVVTGELQVDGEVVPTLTDADRRKLGVDTTFVPPVALAVKEGDDLLTRVSFVRGETVQDIDIDSMRLVLKEYEPENELVVSSEPIEKQGASTSTNYLLHTKFDGNLLASSLSNYESDEGTYFYALAEIEYVQVNSESVGPSTLTRSSATFCVRIERDLANNP